MSFTQDGGFFDALRDAAFGDKPAKPPTAPDEPTTTKPYRFIVKHGDDLRQDQVVLQSVPVWKSTSVSLCEKPSTSRGAPESLIFAQVRTSYGFIA